MLIQDEKINGRHGGHQQGHGLPLPAGKRPHLNIHLVLQPQPQGSQLLPVAFPPGVVRAPAQVIGLAFVIRQREILEHGQVGTGTQGGVLVHPAKAAVPHKFLLVQHAFAVNDDIAALDWNAAADDIQQGGLAAAVAAHDGNKLARFHRKVKVPEQAGLSDLAGVIYFGDIFKLQHGRRLLSGRSGSR